VTAPVLGAIGAAGVAICVRAVRGWCRHPGVGMLPLVPLLVWLGLVEAAVVALRLGSTSDRTTRVLPI
jgi:hypothetical protein